MKTTLRVMLLGLVVVAAAVGGWEIAALAQGASRSMPVFEVDPSWPKLPNNWVVGTVSSVTVDRRDHVWILHRPGTVPQNLKTQAAPPVLEFDANGAFLNAWGGADQGYAWPLTEHGITVDYKDVVWIGGSGVTDDMLLKFTTQASRRRLERQSLHGGSEPRQSRPEVPLQGHVVDASAERADRLASGAALGTERDARTHW